MPKYGKKRNYRRMARKSVVKTALRKAKSANIARVVKRVISRNAEVKTACALSIANQQNVPGAGLNFGAGLGWTSAGSIMPVVDQGPADGQRIGNVITVKKAQIKYTIRAIDVSQNTGNNPYPGLPFLVRVVAYSHRLDKTDNSNTGILETGSGSQNLGSTPDFWIEPYNKREFVIHYSKQFLMQPIRTTFAGSGYQTDNVATGSKQFIAKKVNLKHVPKKWFFNDAGGGNAPTNCGVMLAFAVCNIDGSVITPPHARAMINVETYITYNDF